MEKHLDEIAQTIRRSHCARPAEERHNCVGECTFTRAGIRLACKLCGDQDETGALRDEAWKLAKSVLAAAGMDIERLGENVQAEAAAVCRAALREKERA